MTNHVALIILVVTNWVSIGTFSDKNGKQWDEQQAVVTTNTYVEEVTLCTNRTLYHVEDGPTNGVRRVPMVVPPPLPNWPPFGTNIYNFVPALRQ